MVTAVVAAASAAAILAAVVIAVRLAGARSERRFEAVLGQLDHHMEAISENLQRAVERSQDARTTGIGEVGLTLDLAELLDRFVEEAALRTGAQAAAVRVRGPGDLHATASFGVDDGASLLGAALGPPDARPFRALTLAWSYGPSPEGDAGPFRSALVVPVLEDGIETGALAAFARAPSAFRP